MARRLSRGKRSGLVGSSVSNSARRLRRRDRRLRLEPLEDRRLLSAAGIETTLIGDPVTKEDGTSAAFRVALESQPTDPVTVSMQSDDPTEGVVFFGGELIFTVGEWNMPQIVMVTGVDDAEADGQQSYAISLLATSDDLD